MDLALETRGHCQPCISREMQSRTPCFTFYFVAVRAVRPPVPSAACTVNLSSPSQTPSARRKKKLSFLQNTQFHWGLESPKKVVKSSSSATAGPWLLCTQHWYCCSQIPCTTQDCMLWRKEDSLEILWSAWPLWLSADVCLWVNGKKKDGETLLHPIKLVQKPSSTHKLGTTAQ